MKLPRIGPLMATLVLFCMAPVATGAEEIAVFKTPSCGCCSKWASYLERQGFLVQAHEVADLVSIKRQYGVPAPLFSCHTAVVGKYVIEGHVPVEDIRRLLREQPDILGIAVPDMPLGSPGMESPTPEPYDVLSFDREGRTSVFARH